MPAGKWNYSLEAKAKLNLFLEVLQKRKDGFHDLHSVFQEINLSDTLHAAEADNISLECDALGIPTGTDNLIIKAVSLLREAAGIKSGIRLFLEKRIPAEGGLGGGSSDAACALKLACKIWRINPGLQDLADIALKVGSDVPFFLYGGTCLCEGRGERVAPLTDINKLEYHIVRPDWGVSTASAYACLKNYLPGRRRADLFIDALQKGDPERIAAESFNRFEEAVFVLEPQQKKLHNTLMTKQPLCVRMSGSGSSIWCLSREGQTIRDLTEGVEGIKEIITTETA